MAKDEILTPVAPTLRVTARFKRPGDRRKTMLPVTRQEIDEERANRPTSAAVLLATAHRLDDLLRSGQAATLAELARTVGVTVPRVSQILSLLLLAPDIQEAILHQRGAVDQKLVPSERELRRIAAEAEWTGQRRTWRSLFHANTSDSAEGSSATPTNQIRPVAPSEPIRP